MQKRHWSSLEGAAAVLQAYLLVRLREDKGPPTYALTDDEIWNWAVESGAVSIPSELQVMKDGRADLRYIIRVSMLGLTLVGLPPSEQYQLSESEAHLMSIDFVVFLVLLLFLRNTVNENWHAP